MHSLQEGTSLIKYTHTHTHTPHTHTCTHTHSHTHTHTHTHTHAHAHTHARTHTDIMIQGVFIDTSSGDTSLTAWPVYFTRARVGVRDGAHQLRRIPSWRSFPLSPSFRRLQQPLSLEASSEWLVCWADRGYRGCCWWCAQRRQ